MEEEGRQIIFNMVKVGKTLPSGKKILNDIYLGLSLIHIWLCY